MCQNQSCGAEATEHSRYQRPAPVKTLIFDPVVVLYFHVPPARRLWIPVSFPQSPKFNDGPEDEVICLGQKNPGKLQTGGTYGCCITNGDKREDGTHQAGS